MMHRQRYNHKNEVIIHHQNQADENSRLSREWRDLAQISDNRSFIIYSEITSSQHQRLSAAYYAAARELQGI